MDSKKLSEYDFEIGIDKSSSMGEKDGGATTRWARAEEVTTGYARHCEKYDSDGITVSVFSGKHKTYENVKGGGDVVANIFAENEPNGSTNTAGYLQARLDDYFHRKAKGIAKPLIISIITDGIPDDQAALEQVIIDATKKMDKDEELGITFLQIGSDPKASAFLKTLDDGLQAKGAKFDIVDTKTFEEIGNMSLNEVLIAALED